MKKLIFLLLAILSCQTLEAKKPVSVYISYDEAILLKENICYDFFSFKKEFLRKFPKSKIYYYILPKATIVIEFDMRYLNIISNSNSEENRNIIREYYLEIENTFPEIEKSFTLESERAKITLMLPQCEYLKDIEAKIKKISIEYKNQRINILRLVRITRRSENEPGTHEKHQIEMKIFLNNGSVTESDLRKYLKKMKTIEKYFHEIKILQ
ncbi:MAG: hypothetical protein OEZ13_11295 [Spirochaetia bacterium]|nr:hypothetical protein [Spirochaetia bacterium]